MQGISLLAEEILASEGFNSVEFAELNSASALNAQTDHLC
jgi:hypothetical protein